jgi:cytochrome b6-f complex iron-sulfur subunit
MSGAAMLNKHCSIFFVFWCYIYRNIKLFMNRREFIEKACLGGIGIVAGTSIINSLEIKTLKAFPRSDFFHGNREIPLLLEDTPELQTVGGAYHLQIDEIEKDILVVRTGDDTFLAVDIKCTHKGCDVKYDGAAATPMFVCPCHDSRFDMNGIPKSGPAKKPLAVYQTSFKNGEVTIQIPVEDDEPAANPTNSPSSDSVSTSKGSVTAKDSTTKK